MFHPLPLFPVPNGETWEPALRLCLRWTEEERRRAGHPETRKALKRISREFRQLKQTMHSADPMLFCLRLMKAARALERCSRRTDLAEKERRPSRGARDADRATVTQTHTGIPPGKHVLPPLPWSHDALEPYISGQIMRLHHDEHHQAYVNGLNRAERELEEARRSGRFELVKHWEREAAFHGAGHYLHTLFWETMSPDGGGEPSGSLRRQILQDFGSFESFVSHFSAAAENVEGNGWAILVWSPRAHRLDILTAEKHQNLSQWDVIPLLPLDVWEHAYYLQYPNRRGEYIKAWWNVVDWNRVRERFRTAFQVTWKPY